MGGNSPTLLRKGVPFYGVSAPYQLGWFGYQNKRFAVIIPNLIVRKLSVNEKCGVIWFFV